ncbi:MAG: Ig-like domain-containing protein [Bacteroidetes bacterium]|nr:Ig-like domain-containing protein [Bacteroidota bacterium]
MIISPIIKPAPEISVKNKNVVIRFTESLQTNTTYTINFGNSITDVHEGNSYEGYQFVFSTGASLDSSSVKGKVYFANNLKTEKGIVVVLYTNSTDSAPYKTMPDYFTKTDDGGNFSIKNIRNTSYKLFALKETDGNYLFNSVDEQIAFNNELVNANDTTGTELALFKEEDPKFFIKTKGFAEKGKFVLVFNKPLGNIELKNLSAENIPVEQKEFSIQKDSLILWMKDTMVNNLNFTLWNNEQLIDTVVFTEKKTTNKPTGRDSDVGFKLRASINTEGLIKTNDTLVITFSAPLVLSKSNPEKIQLTKDSITSIPFTTEWIDSSNRKLKIIFKPIEQEVYKLFIPPKNFTSIFGLSNDSLVFNITTLQSTKLGSVLVKLSGINEGNYLLQLVNDKDETIYQRKITRAGKYLFELIDPLKYKLRLVYDSNSNGKWDTGNYLKKNSTGKKLFTLHLK